MPKEFFLPRYVPVSVLDDIIDEVVREPCSEQVYTIDFLTVKMGWGLGRIDEELRKGNIVKMNKGGKSGYKFLRELGQTAAQQYKQVYKNVRVNSRIGMQLRHGTR